MQLIAQNNSKPGWTLPSEVVVAETTVSVFVKCALCRHIRRMFWQREERETSIVRETPWKRKRLRTQAVLSYWSGSSALTQTISPGQLLNSWETCPHPALPLTVHSYEQHIKPELHTTMKQRNRRPRWGGTAETEVQSSRRQRVGQLLSKQDALNY